jgi:hypothetical protein
MQGTVVYMLRFRSPLHIGERGIGQEQTREYAPADTLFSALCTMWSLLYGVQSLTDDLLTRYGDAGREPFFLTSAFPFAGEVRFYPKPLRPPDSNPDFAKRWKSIRWVSERVFQAYLNGEPIALEPEGDNMPNGAASAAPARTAQILIHPDERQALQQFWDYEADDLRDLSNGSGTACDSGSRLERLADLALWRGAFFKRLRAVVRGAVRRGALPGAVRGVSARAGRHRSGR